MFQGPLPDRIDPLALARTGARLEGELDVGAMTRLQDLLAGPEGRVAVALEFGVDVEGVRFIDGRLRAQVRMRCQRCLETMAVEVEQPIHLGLASSEEAARRLPGHYEPLELDGEPVSLAELVEDELLLALPVAPLHPQEECPAAGTLPAQVDEEPGQSEERPNPFRALADWKRQSD